MYYEASLFVCQFAIKLNGSGSLPDRSFRRANLNSQLVRPDGVKFNNPNNLVNPVNLV